MCVYIFSIKTTCWWVALYLGFHVCALSYQLNLSSFLFHIASTYTWEKYVCVCICMCACVHACSPFTIYRRSPLWPKVNGWRSSLVSASIVWGSSGSVLAADGFSARDAVNHSETPRYNISIVYLFSLRCVFLSSPRRKKLKRAGRQQEMTRTKLSKKKLKMLFT